MDIQEIWQEHKVFILTVLGILIAFVAAEIYIGGLCDESRALEVRIRRDLTSLKNKVEYKNSDLSRIKKEKEKLGKDAEHLASRLEFKTRDSFQLRAEDREPDLTYNRKYREAVETVVEEGAASGVDIDPSLGLPDVTPAGREEIEEYLKLLDLVVRVARLAVENQVRAIPKIKILKERGSLRVTRFFKETAVDFEIISHPESLCLFLEDLQKPEFYLPLGKSSLSLSKEDPEMVKANIRVLSMEIDLEKPYEEAGKRAQKR